MTVAVRRVTSMPIRGDTTNYPIPDDRWPFPDPDRPGLYRLPLDAAGDRFLIDTGSLPLVLGRRCAWMPGPSGTRGYAYRSDTHKGSTKLARVITGVTRRHSWSASRTTTRSTADALTSSLGRRAACRRGHKPRTAAGGPPSSSFKGVSRERSLVLWKASIQVAGRRATLGRFHDKIAAAEAYDEAAREHFGDAARLNFPDGA